MSWAFLILALVVAKPPSGDFWGFYAHKMINRLAVYTLPPSMLSFYKYHIYDISQGAVKADQRRYAVKEEAPRHYIDLDYYGNGVSEDWIHTREIYSEKSLQSHGILPWHLKLVKYRLTQAMMAMDAEAIVALSADAGHYLADAHVPLHTTSNYNGQKTGQHGIHGFWETRVPELLWESFELWVGKARYRQDYYCDLWDVLWESYHAVDSVLNFEKDLTAEFSGGVKYGYEQRGTVTTKVFSKSFTWAYHRRLDGQVERRLRAAIKFVGDFWYTCWIDAGQPDLHQLTAIRRVDEIEKMDDFWKNGHVLRDSIP